MLDLCLVLFSASTVSLLVCLFFFLVGWLVGWLVICLL